MHRRPQGMPARRAFLGRGWIGSVVEEETDHREVVTPRGRGDGTVMTAILFVGERSVAREVVTEELMVAPKCRDEDGVSRAALEQGIGDRRAAVARRADRVMRHQREVDRAVAVAPYSVGIGTRGQELLHDVESAIVRGAVKSSVAG